MTKEDLANFKADLIKWLIGTQIALAALIIYLLQQISLQPPRNPRH